MLMLAGVVFFFSSFYPPKVTNFNFFKFEIVNVNDHHCKFFF
jgi:hypothetical protein